MPDSTNVPLVVMELATDEKMEFISARAPTDLEKVVAQAIGEDLVRPESKEKAPPCKGCGAPPGLHTIVLVRVGPLVASTVVFSCQACAMTSHATSYMDLRDLGIDDESDDKSALTALLRLADSPEGANL